VREVGLQRARAASALMLALPGGAYVYQGEELGLPEVINLPDDARQDPTWFRTNGERYGRDGCRVPIPWEAQAPAYGFNSTGAAWLPQPDDWAPYARDAQLGVEGSTLELYRAALRVRRAESLGLGSLEWIDGLGDDVIAFTNGTVTVVANTGSTEVTLPETLAGAELILSSGDFDGATLGADTTVWLRSA
jgi:alpha-glucosidase